MTGQWWSIVQSQEVPTLSVLGQAAPPSPSLMPTCRLKQDCGGHGGPEPPVRFRGDHNERLAPCPGTAGFCLDPDPLQRGQEESWIQSSSGTWLATGQRKGHSCDLLQVPLLSHRNQKVLTIFPPAPGERRSTGCLGHRLGRVEPALEARPV